MVYWCYSPEGPLSVCGLILLCLFVLGVSSVCLHLSLSLCPVHPVSIWMLYNWLFFGLPACPSLALIHSISKGDSNGCPYQTK